VPRPSRYVWDPAAGRYRVRRTGRFVRRVDVRAALDDALDARGRAMRGITHSYLDGRITLSAWRIEMRAAIKNVHIWSAVLAEGGWSQFTPSKWGRLGAVVRREYAFLERLVQQIRAGDVSEARLLERERLYLEHGRATYHKFERDVQRGTGMIFERSVLGVADHCTECLAEAGRGWVPIGALVPIGERQCLSNCRCSIAYVARATSRAAA
jgi:hypothetical protein